MDTVRFAPFHLHWQHSRVCLDGDQTVPWTLVGSNCGHFGKPSRPTRKCSSSRHVPYTLPDASERSHDSDVLKKARKAKLGSLKRRRRHARRNAFEACPPAPANTTQFIIDDIEKRMQDDCFEHGCDFLDGDASNSEFVEAYENARVQCVEAMPREDVIDELVRREMDQKHLESRIAELTAENRRLQRLLEANGIPDDARPRLS